MAPVSQRSPEPDPPSLGQDPSVLPPVLLMGSLKLGLSFLRTAFWDGRDSCNSVCSSHGARTGVPWPWMAASAGCASSPDQVSWAHPAPLPAPRLPALPTGSSAFRASHTPPQAPRLGWAGLSALSALSRRVAVPSGPPLQALNSAHARADLPLLQQLHSGDSPFLHQYFPPRGANLGLTFCLQSL